MTDYAEYLASKRQHAGMDGFEPMFMPAGLFDFQRALVEWAVRKGRAAIFADCGLGKTVMQLAWAQNVVQHTNRPVLVLTPLAVAHQTVQEGVKFGIECQRSTDGAVRSQITVTNYERLHLFDPADWAGVVCDESSILKSFDGARRQAITAFMRGMRYRILSTATAAPNDYIELGTSSEALGYLGHMDMLNRFFANNRNNSANNRMHGANAEWRLKGHAEEPFWRWVVSWARALRRPSDIGFDDGPFILPPLDTRHRVVTALRPREGMLFNMRAVGLAEEREERRRTIPERCEALAEAVADTGKPALVWCHLNDEGDLLTRLIPDAVQVAGADSDDAKEERLQAFADGHVRVLVTKPKIGAWGLNFQRCAHVASFVSHSFEQHYQGVRRCWRFGQTHPVTVDLFASEGEESVLDNLNRKAGKAAAMFEKLVETMGRELAITRADPYTEKAKVPAWL